LLKSQSSIGLAFYINKHYKMKGHIYMINLGLLIIRLVVGITFIGHGTQKLFGWFGGYGLKRTGDWLESIGVKPGIPMAFLAGIGELVGGILFATGTLIYIGAFFIVVAMLVAILKVHWKYGYWFTVTTSGFEYNFILITIVTGITLTGPGAYVLF
jgi:putative oxidoreductase